LLTTETKIQTDHPMPKKTDKTDKPEFIANVDDANAEVARLHGENADLSAKLEKAEADLEKANEKATSLETDLKAEQAKVTKAEADLKAEQAKVTKAGDDLKAEQKKSEDLQAELVKQKGKTSKTIASAGVNPLEEEGKTGADSDKDDLKGLSGLQRAIRANQIKADEICGRK
jgi:chromosome segregation ATPase